MILWLFLLTWIDWIQCVPVLTSHTVYHKDSIDVVCRITIDFTDNIIPESIILEKTNPANKIDYVIEFYRAGETTIPSLCSFRIPSNNIQPVSRYKPFCRLNDQRKLSRALVLRMYNLTSTDLMSTFLCQSPQFNLTSEPPPIRQVFTNIIKNLRPVFKVHNGNLKWGTLACTTSNKVDLPLKIPHNFPAINGSFTYEAFNVSETKTRDLFYRQVGRNHPIGLTKHPREYTNPCFQQYFSPDNAFYSPLRARGFSQTSFQIGKRRGKQIIAAKQDPKIECFTGEDMVFTPEEDCNKYVFMGTKEAISRLQSMGKQPYSIVPIPTDNSHIFNLEEGEYCLDYSTIVFAPPHPTGPIYYNMSHYQPTLAINALPTSPVYPVNRSDYNFVSIQNTNYVINSNPSRFPYRIVGFPVLIPVMDELLMNYNQLFIDLASEYKYMIVLRIMRPEWENEWNEHFSIGDETERRLRAITTKCQNPDEVRFLIVANHQDLRNLSIEITIRPDLYKTALGYHPLITTKYEAVTILNEASLMQRYYHQISSVFNPVIVFCERRNTPVRVVTVAQHFATTEPPRYGLSNLRRSNETTYVCRDKLMTASRLDDNSSPRFIPLELCNIHLDNPTPLKLNQNPFYGVLPTRGDTLNQLQIKRDDFFRLVKQCACSVQLTSCPMVFM